MEKPLPMDEDGSFLIFKRLVSQEDLAQTKGLHLHFKESGTLGVCVSETQQGLSLYKSATWLFLFRPTAAKKLVIFCKVGWYAFVREQELAARDKFSLHRRVNLETYCSELFVKIQKAQAEVEAVGEGLIVRDAAEVEAVAEESIMTDATEVEAVAEEALTMDAAEAEALTIEHVAAGVAEVEMQRPVVPDAGPDVSC